MPASEPSLTVGIEEEYLLVDVRTRALATEAPLGLVAECERMLGPQVSPEFLRSQIEVGTRPCRTIAEARADLQRLRSGVVSCAAQFGLAPPEFRPVRLCNSGRQCKGEQAHAATPDVREQANRVEPAQAGLAGDFHGRRMLVDEPLVEAKGLYIHLARDSRSGRRPAARTIKASHRWSYKPPARPATSARSIT